MPISKRPLKLPVVALAVVAAVSLAAGIGAANGVINNNFNIEAIDLQTQTFATAIFGATGARNRVLINTTCTNQSQVQFPDQVNTLRVDIIADHPDQVILRSNVARVQQRRKGNNVVLRLTAAASPTCTAGLEGEPCVANADCDAPPGVCTGLVCTEGLVDEPCVLNSDCDAPAGICTDLSFAAMDLTCAHSSARGTVGITQTDALPINGRFDAKGRDCTGMTADQAQYVVDTCAFQEFLKINVDRNTGELTRFSIKGRGAAVIPGN